MITQETYFINVCYALVCIVFILICRILWYSQDVPNIELHYTQSSNFIPKILQNCTTLNEKYIPTLLWGKSGHFQSILHTIIGRVGNLPLGQSRRFQISAEDGSILSYDIFEPSPDKKKFDELILMVPGICNHAESKYIRAFSDHLISNGYRVAVFNHTGALKSVELKRPRIFTYGQTDDLDAVVNHLLKTEKVERFIAIGFSLGGNILMKYLGEKLERQKHFLFAVSVCQGYDIPEAADFFRAGDNLRWLYDYGLARNMLKVVNHHKDRLESYCRSEKIDVDWDQVLASRALGQLDESLILKLCKQSDIDSFYEENSSSRFMNKISIPMLIINALDDPIVPESLFKYPKDLLDVNENTLFVVMPYGGHLGFFEGGIMVPNKLSWMDRMLTEFFYVATKVIKEKSNNKLVDECATGEVCA